jgi:hypothetical protein
MTKIGPLGITALALPHFACTPNHVKGEPRQTGAVEPELWRFYLLKASRTTGRCPAIIP